VLGNAHQMAQVGEVIEDIRDSVSSARRDLFPELADDVMIDIDEDPFSDVDAGGGMESGDDESGGEADDEAEVMQQ